MDRDKLFVCLSAAIVIISLLALEITGINPISSQQYIPGSNGTVYSSDLSGLIQQGAGALGFQTEVDSSNTLPDTFASEMTDMDNFPVTDQTEAQLQSVTPLSANDYSEASAFPFKYYELNFPLKPVDYYWGKWENAKAGAGELNRMPDLGPGDRIQVINKGFITMSPARGYIRPQNGYYFASGVCWATSTLGGFMDKANWYFMQKWHIQLFTYNRGDRVGHPHNYPTYADANGGYGYTIFKSGNRGAPDYGFNINPALKNNPYLKNLRVKIVMTWSNSFPDASHGQNIGAYLLTNISLDGGFTIQPVN